MASLLLSTILIAGPAISFCIKIYFIIRHRTSEGKNATAWYPVFAIGTVLTILVIVTILHCHVLVLLLFLAATYLPILYYVGKWIYTIFKLSRTLVDDKKEIKIKMKGMS